MHQKRKINLDQLHACLWTKITDLTSCQSTGSHRTSQCFPFKSLNDQHIAFKSIKGKHSKLENVFEATDGRRKLLLIIVTLEQLKLQLILVSQLATARF